MTGKQSIKQAKMKWYFIWIYAKEARTMSHMKIKCASGMIKYYGIDAFDATIDIIMEEVLVQKKNTLSTSGKKKR